MLDLNQKLKHRLASAFSGGYILFLIVFSSTGLNGMKIMIVTICYSGIKAYLILPQRFAQVSPLEALRVTCHLLYLEKK